MLDDLASARVPHAEAGPERLSRRDLSLAAAWRLSLGQHHERIWFIECGVRECYHDSDMDAHARRPGLREDEAVDSALCHQARNLTP